MQGTLNQNRSYNCTTFCEGDQPAANDSLTLEVGGKADAYFADVVQINDSYSLKGILESPSSTSSVGGNFFVGASATEIKAIDGSFLIRYPAFQVGTPGGSASYGPPQLSKVHVQGGPKTRKDSVNRAREIRIFNPDSQFHIEFINKRQ